MAEGGEVFVFDMGKPIKIIDLARNMIRLAGFIPDVDMPIRIVGERPGEKLYEDLFLDSELLKETYNEKIMISKETNFQIEDADKIIKKLQSLKNFYDPVIFKNVIRDLLPEYKYLPSSEQNNGKKGIKHTEEFSYQN